VASSEDEDTPGQRAAGADPADARARPDGRRLTVYFVSLVLLMALAAAAASIYVFVQTDRDARSAARRDARFSSERAAKQLGDGIALVRATVAGLAATPGIDESAAQPTCSLTFGLDGDLYRGHVDVLRPDGSVACSSRPRTGATLSGYRGAAWLGRARAGPLFPARVVFAATGDVSLLAARGTAGKGAVVAFVALAPVGRALEAVHGGGRPVEFVVTSGDGRTVLSRSIDPERWVGRPAGGALPAAGGERRDADGTPRLYEQASVAGVGWRLFVGEDEAAALAAGNRLRERQLLIILTGLVLVVVATFAVYRRVAVPIRRLGGAVRATSTRTPLEPVPVGGPAEVTELAVDVNGLIRSVNAELEKRRAAEEKALRSERSYRQMFESSPLPMFIYDASSHAILAANDAAVRDYGYAPEAFLAMTIEDVTSSENDARSEIRLLESSEISTHRASDGQIIRARTITHPVRFDDRPAYCMVAEDVGERERIESQLRQTQKMEAVGQLAGGIAHDFNNLLTVIRSVSSLALRTTPDRSLREQLGQIDNAAARAAELTGQLLAFSRRQVLRPAQLDLNAVVDDTLNMLERVIGDDIELVFERSESVPPIVVDRGQLGQVILNLAVNARDAMSSGGMILVRTGAVSLDEGYALGHLEVQPGEYALLELTDTGAGMDEETRTRAFEPFFTTKAEGTGLGLATVYGVVKQSGGHITIYSEPGIGTTFRIYFPSATGVAAELARESVDRDVFAGSETILLVEDSALVRTAVAQVLTAYGYDVLVAASGPEALEIAAANSGIDLVLTDMVMPEMHGTELAARLAETHPAIKQLFTSGYPAGASAGRHVSAADARFIQRPFVGDELVAEIRSILDGD
jgi:PAS domain S-box-containing protein